MADQTAPVVSIKNLPLNEVQRDRLNRLLADPLTSTHNIRDFLSDVQSSIATPLDEATLTRLEGEVARMITVPRQQALPTPPQDVNTSAARNMSGALLGAAIAFGTRDSSESQQIIDSLNGEQQNELLGNDNGLLQRIMSEQDDVARALLLEKELDPDVLTDKRIAALKRRLEKHPSATQKEKALLESLSKKKPDRTKESVWRKRRREKEEEEQKIRNKAETDLLLATLRNPKISESGKKQALSAYISRRQLQGNERLDNLLARRGFLRTTSRFSRSVRKGLQVPVKERLQPENNTYDKSAGNTPANMAEQDITVEETTVTQGGEPSQELVSSSEDTSGAPRPQISPRNSMPHIPGIGKAGKQLLVKSVFSQPEFWAFLGAIIFVFLIIIIIIILLINITGDQGGNPIEGQVEQLTCADATYAVDVKAFLGKYAQKVDDTYHIMAYTGYSASDPHFEDAVSAYRNIFNTLCILYGHTTGGLSGKDQYNSFAAKLLGDHLQTIDGKLIFVGYNGRNKLDQNNRIIDKASVPKDYLIRIDVGFDDKKPDCTVGFFPSITHDQIIQILLANPQNCSQYKLQYLLAQSLSHAILIQQDKQFGRNKSVFTNFLQNTYDPFNMLPTSSCQNYPTLSYGGDATPGTQGADTMGENADFQEARNCFGDMVGSYITYPWYYATSSAKMTPNPLLTYPTGKYQDYYNFAKNNLFDGMDLVVATSSAQVASCPSFVTDVPTIRNDLTDWGFTVQAKNGLNPSNAVWQNLYQTICLDYQSAKFRQLVAADKSLPGATPITIVFSTDACRLDKKGPVPAGRTDSSNNIIYLCMNYGNPVTIDPSADHLQFYLNHELGHIIQDRNPNIKTAWDTLFNTNILNPQAKPPISDLLLTLNCNGHWGITADECFSDATTLYTLYGNFNDGSFGGAFAQYPRTYYTNFDTNSRWSDYYSFMNTNVFGGTVFFASAGKPGSGKAMADYAVKLVHDIVQSCPDASSPWKSITFVHSRGCILNVLTGLKPLYPARVINDLTSESAIESMGPHTQPNLQCVAFARAVTDGMNHPLTRPTQEGRPNGNAHNYAGTSQPGYTWCSKKDLQTGTASCTPGVKPGDVAVFGPGPSIADHIGIVSSIIGNGKGAFYLAEANGGTGMVDVSSDRHVPYSATNADFDGVFRLK